MASFKAGKDRGRPPSRLLKKRGLFKSKIRLHLLRNMGQNYAKHVQVSGMLKHPVDCYGATKTHREAVHGPSDFALVVKGTRFDCHKKVLMAASRYFETMLTMFDERSKSEVELKEIIEANTMALSLHFVYSGDVPGVRKRIVNKRNVQDILQLAIYLQIQVCSADVLVSSLH